MWNLLAPVLLGTVLGEVGAHQQRQAKKGHDKMRRAQMRYSPWTGMTPDPEMQVPNSFEGALGGAMSGLKMAAFLGANKDILGIGNKGGLDVSGNLQQRINFPSSYNITEDFQPWDSLRPPGGLKMR